MLLANISPLFAPGQLKFPFLAPVQLKRLPVKKVANQKGCQSNPALY
jgi:hypothetical protein